MKGIKREFKCEGANGDHITIGYQWHEKSLLHLRTRGSALRTCDLERKMKGEGRSHQEGRDLLLPWVGTTRAGTFTQKPPVRPVCKTICRLSSMTTHLSSV